jgi:Skp family chaperone for outer membrane proteins
MKTIISILFFIFTLLGAFSLHADIYSWTDENGVRHFGNQPPQDAADVKMVFKEYPHNSAAHQQRIDMEEKEWQKLIQEIEAEDERQRAEERKKAEEAQRNRKPTRQEMIEAEKKRLEARIAELEEKPLEYFGSQRNKILRLGFYRYRLEALMQDPDKYFSKPVSFEGNVKFPQE